MIMDGRSGGLIDRKAAARQGMDKTSILALANNGMQPDHLVIGRLRRCVRWMWPDRGEIMRSAVLAVQTSDQQPARAFGRIVFHYVTLLRGSWTIPGIYIAGNAIKKINLRFYSWPVVATLLLTIIKIEFIIIGARGEVYFRIDLMETRKREWIVNSNEAEGLPMTLKWGRF